MELIVQITSREALDGALASGVNGVTIDLPRGVDQAWWAEVAAWQTAARGRGVAFYLQWDSLIREEELSQALETLAKAAALQPDALILRDPGLCREARKQHPELILHAAENCGYHNSPGLRLAEGLGYRRVVLAGPLHLKDLALMRRQTTLPLEIVLPRPCPGHLCLLEEYLGTGCSSCCQPSRWQPEPTAGLLAALEMLPGLAQLGVAAVRLGWVFSQARSLERTIELCQMLWEASAAERPRLLATARDVLAAFGAGFGLEYPAKEALPAKGSPVPAAAAGGPQATPERPQSASGSGRIWLEARNYAEAAFLTREWREPLVLQLNPENYTAFLGQYHRWHPRRFIWRLPPLLPESALPFLRQAILTLKQGGFSRFLAGDWGAVELAREAGGLVYGEQTLGVRNSRALLAANELGISRVCLPPGHGPQDWQELVQAAPRGSFWGYLYHLPALTVCSGGDADLAVPDGEKLRWLSEGDLALLIPKAAEHLEACRGWFEQKWVAPLVISLVHSNLPWGQVPALARPPQPPRPERQGAGGRGQGPKRPGPGGRGQGAGKKGPFPSKPGGRSSSPPRSKPAEHRRPEGQGGQKSPPRPKPPGRRRP